jgi:hypothetical protein
MTNAWAVFGVAMSSSPWEGQWEKATWTSPPRSVRRKCPVTGTKKPGWKAGLAWGAIEVALGVGRITWP